MKTSDNNSATQTSYDRVKQVREDMIKTLLEYIETNPTNWQSGWSSIAAGVPYNGKTNTAYRGLNALYLACVSATRGYKDNRWVTFNQAKDLGASVKRGEKSTPVLFFEYYDRATKKAFDNSTVKDMSAEDKAQYLKENVYALMKYSNVFNAEQCYNFPERKEIAMSEEERARQNSKIETIIAHSAAPIFFDGGDRAFYSPNEDEIHLPTISAFDTMQDYYATALHEIAHSTGHQSRLNRDLSGEFGGVNYAVEELRAELSSVFLQMETGIHLDGKHIENHAAYLNSWLKAAKEDLMVFSKAAVDAQKIADYIDEHYLSAWAEQSSDANAVASNEKNHEENKQGNVPQQDHEVAGEYNTWANSKSELKRSYAALKARYSDAIVMMRLGDFYEILGSDAERVAKAIDLTLTGRDIDGERVPMAGVPYHTIDDYAAKIVNELNCRVILSDKVSESEMSAQNVRTNASDINYEKVMRTDFPKDFADEDLFTAALLDGAENKEAQQSTRQNREWLTIELTDESVVGQYGSNTLVRMPKEGEYAYYAFYIPSKYIKEDVGMHQMTVSSDYIFQLNNDGKQVKLSGKELSESFAGETIGKKPVRVAPSRRYAKNLDNIEKNIPPELKEIPTWCCYRTKWNDEKGKKDKFIISPIDGKWANSKEANRWVTFSAALKYARENSCEGLSVLLNKNYRITCIDLDKCITDNQTGALKERASKLTASLADTYIERSTSGNGLHIFLKDDILQNGKYNMTSTNEGKGDLEVYDDNRIISVTGDMYSKSNNLTRAGSAATVYLRSELGEHKSISNKSVEAQKTTTALNMSDSELIRWIQSSKQGSKFNDLYQGRGVSGNRSEDDAKLAHMLLYFNGGDKEQAFRILRDSGLYRPNKPDAYYRKTIDKMDEKISLYAKRPTLSVAGTGKEASSKKNFNQA